MQPTLNLGFLTIVDENKTYAGGYLVTNSWGRPLEFRLTTAVEPNSVQEALYGRTLKPYLYSDLIGKTLLEKTGASAQLIVVDAEAALDLRLHVSAPVVWLASPDDSCSLEHAGVVRTTSASSFGPLFREDDGKEMLLVRHPRFPGDADIVRRTLQQLDPSFDLTEIFARVRQALGEARKMGATSRAA